MRRSDPLRFLLAALVATLVAIVPTAPAAATTKPLGYVALGDSYSAASGVLPPDPAAPPECLRSSRNYPHVIARAVAAQLTDVTCGAAETSDFFTSQYGNVPPQLGAVGRRTGLVTMTIGGNDNGVFVNTIVDCGSAGVSTGGRGSPCKDKYGSSFAHTIRAKTYPALVKALRTVVSGRDQAIVRPPGSLRFERFT